MSVEARFSIGQIIDHRLFGYRGVVVSVDSEFSLSEDWYEQVARSRPPRDQPWYHVLVHGATHTTYVAEQNMQAADDTTQIDHPLLGRFFDRFDGKRYFPRQTRH